MESVRPKFYRLCRSPKTERLYQLEFKRNEIIKQCAKEWSKVMGISESRFWEEAVPQALFDTLVGFAPSSSRPAAEAYCEYHEVNPK